jgi:hypothetical protein
VHVYLNNGICVIYSIKPNLCQVRGLLLVAGSMGSARRAGVGRGRGAEGGVGRGAAGLSNGTVHA